MNTTSNSNTTCSKGSPAIGICILATAFTLGLPGNLFVIWTVLLRLRKRSITSVLILNLAAADAVVLLTAPFFIRYLAVLNWEFGQASCKIMHYICSVNMYASIFIIAFMSLDRLFGISKPFLSQKVRTKPKVRRLALALWVLAFLLATPMLFYRSVVTSKGRRWCNPVHTSSVHKVFQYLVETISSFLVPFTVMTVSYFCICLRLRKGRFKRRSRRKSSRLIISVVVSFAVFWMPYHIVNILQVVGMLSGSKALEDFATCLRPSLTAFAFVSSSVNPILYAFVGTTFIRTSGLNFVAKLLEGTSSEMSSLKKSGRALQEKEEEEKIRKVDCVELEQVTNAGQTGEDTLKQDLEPNTKAPNC
ncbi:LT4R1 protein, partial [Polyodon spathula]|nr:leukotriene B4 receptor 1-like [Polyodon spathula]XP_041092816.1 leukotriene B4 receptor 1-like [Polyodon spathula]XP_041092818.1 leukotriene B4 receptor 1-like [Polyodon spathula]MBN3279464.1 LT4R1 protein [Polyodon spathula]